MSIDLEVLLETYNTMKQYVPSKDRQEMADTLIGIIGDYLDEEELQEFCTADSKTKKALRDYLPEDDMSDED